MPIYENSVIYKLKHNEDYDDLNIYIGSTTNFRGRKNAHKGNCNNEKKVEYNYQVYQYIRDNGGWDDWVMIPIEQYSCDSKKELEIKERYYIDLLRPTLNKYIPTRTLKEYYEANKEYCKEKSKKYHEDNKEIINQKHKEYYKNNKEIINQKHKEYRENNKEYSKEHSKKYYENNKEFFKEKHKQYYEANKEKFKEYFKEKVICDHCGCEITKVYLNKHQKSKKCLNNKKI